MSKSKAREDKRAATRHERDLIHQSVISVIRGERQDADLTQEEVAELMGWSKDVVVNFENSRRDYGVADLILFARKIKKDPAVIFSRILFHLKGK